MVLQICVCFFFALADHRCKFMVSKATSHSDQCEWCSVRMVQVCCVPCHNDPGMKRSGPSPLVILAWVLILGVLMADVFSAVDALSSSSSHSPKRPASSRGADQQLKRQRKSFSESVSDVTALRAMLGKPKCHCKRRCLSQFSEDGLFSQLHSFRSAWSSFHKLDQDAEDSWGS